MIKSLLICDSNGHDFYSRILDKETNKYNSTLLSGFISAIGTLGRTMFNEEIATISFGYKELSPSIVVVSKDFFGTDKKIFFVFITQGELDLKMVRELCTNIYINNKGYLKQSAMKKSVRDKIDLIVDKYLL